MKSTLNKTRSFFLDFDGVVVESADIKTEAFYDLYLPYGKEVAILAKDYHLNHQGVSRSKKFDAMHELFLGKKCSDDEKKILTKKFSELVFDKILLCPLVDGIIGFLKQQKEKNIPVFLLSATPHDELLNICEKRGLSLFFKEMYGAPFEKSERGTFIMQQHHFAKNDIIFIGDSISDFNAASAIGVNFIGRVKEGDKNPFDSKVKVIKDFKALL